MSLQCAVIRYRIGQAWQLGLVFQMRLCKKCTVTLQARGGCSRTTMTMRNALLYSTSTANLASLLPHSQVQSKFVVSDSSKSETVRQELNDLMYSVNRFRRLRLEDLEYILAQLDNSDSTVSYADGLFLLKCCGKYLPYETANVKALVANKVMNVISKHGKLDVSHYNQLLSGYLENRFEFSPAKFLRLLAEKQIEPNRVTLSRLIGRYCEVGDMPAANDYQNVGATLNDMRSNRVEPTSSTYCQVAQGYVSCGDMDHAKSVISDADNGGGLSSSQWYSLLLSSVESDCKTHFNDMLELIQQHVVQDFTVINDVYNCVLELVSLAHFDEAFRLLCSMPRAPDTPSDNACVFFFKHLLKVNAPAAKMMEFNNRLMQDQNLPCRLAKTAEIELSSGAVDSCVKFLKLIEESGRRVPLSLFSSLLKFYTRVENFNGFLKVLEWMQRVNALDLETVETIVLPITCLTFDQLLHKTFALNHLVSRDRWVVRPSNHERPSVKDVQKIYKRFKEKFASDISDRMNGLLKEVSNAEGIITAMREINDGVSPLTHLYLCAMHTDVGHLEQALQHYTETISKPLPKLPNFLFYALCNLTVLMMQNGRHADIPQLLSLRSFSRPPDANTDAANRCYFAKLLSKAEEFASWNFVREIALLLLTNNYCASPNFYFGLVLRKALLTGKLSEAVDFYTEVTQKFRIVRVEGENEMLKALVLAQSNGDDTLLRKALQAVENCFGERNAGIKLAMTYLEVGRAKDAEKLLASSLLFGAQQWLYKWCSFISRHENCVEIFGHLLSATKQLSKQYQRVRFYEYLFRIYASRKDSASALELWEDMQEDNVEPSNLILKTLSNILNEAGKPLPFALPQRSSAHAAKNVAGFSAIEREIQTTIKAGNWPLLCRIVSDNIRELSSVSYEHAVQALCFSKCHRNACDLIKQRFEVAPRDFVKRRHFFSSLLSWLVSANDLSALQQLSEGFTASVETEVSAKEHHMAVTSAILKLQIQRKNYDEAIAILQAHFDDLPPKATSVCVLHLAKALSMIVSAKVDSKTDKLNSCAAQLWTSFMVGGDYASAQRLEQKFRNIRDFVDVGKYSELARKHENEIALQKLADHVCEKRTLQQLTVNIAQIKVAKADFQGASDVCKSAFESGIRLNDEFYSGIQQWLELQACSSAEQNLGMRPAVTT